MGGHKAEGFRRVLVVDDDTSSLSAMVEALRWSQGYEVDAARGGYEGLVKMGTFQPHLLILDLRMPGFSGFQLCRRVKADPATQATKILAITAYRACDVVEGLREAGADALLEKPFDLRDLMAQAARLVGVPQAESSVPFSFGAERAQEC